MDAHDHRGRAGLRTGNNKKDAIDCLGRNDA